MRFCGPDQTPSHTKEVEAGLATRDAHGQIRWLKLPFPSIPHAMNYALLIARHDIVLFLDDDIIPEEGLVRGHKEMHRAVFPENIIVAGRVIQPWQEGVDFSQDRHFHFASTVPRDIKEFMGGNFSINRRAALKLGGFDENFVRVAYKFEAEHA